MRSWHDDHQATLDDLRRTIDREDRQFGITIGVLFILACVVCAVVVWWP